MYSNNDVSSNNVFNNAMGNPNQNANVFPNVQFNNSNMNFNNNNNNNDNMGGFSNSYPGNANHGNFF